MDNITKLYENQTYYDQYGSSLILFIFITIVVFVLISYFYMMTNIQPIIDDWPNQRCKPTIIPVAGFITHPEGMSAVEYTSQNFTYCMQNILSNITGEALQPLTYTTNSLQMFANNIQNSIQNVRAMFDKVRTMFQSVSEEIMGRIMNVMIPLQEIIINFRDLIGKIQGAMTGGVFTLLGSYYALQSLMGAIAQMITQMLIALAAMIAVFWAVPFTWGAAAANTVIFIAIAIPMSIILSFMTDVMHVKSGLKIPKVKCFDKNTLIKMNDGTMRKIIDVQVGDVLINHNIVTAKIKVTREGSKMYLLNGVIVSDSHIVKHNYQWMPVCHHPNAVRIYNYNEPFLYCLNTSNKRIEINDQIFTDWDDLYNKSLLNILNNNIHPIKSFIDIHKYMDYGFSNKTKITLINQTCVNINEINVNDILENGEKVYGIVEIYGLDMPKNYLYNLGNYNYVEGYLPMLDNYKQFKTNKYNKLYNLLTDKGIFVVGNKIVEDYNCAIDRFLES